MLNDQAQTLSTDTISHILAQLDGGITAKDQNSLFPFITAFGLIYDGDLGQNGRPISANVAKLLRQRVKQAHETLGFVLLNWPQADLKMMIAGILSLVTVWQQRSDRSSPVAGSVLEAAASCKMLLGLMIYYHHSELVREIQAEVNEQRSGFLAEMLGAGAS